MSIELPLVISSLPTCTTSSPERHTAEKCPKVLQQSHHLLCQSAPLQFAPVVLIVVWHAPRRTLQRFPSPWRPGDDFTAFLPSLRGQFRGWVDMIGARGRRAPTRLFRRTALCNDASIVPRPAYLVCAGRPSFVAVIGGVFVKLDSVRAGCRSTVGRQPQVSAACLVFCSQWTRTRLTLRLCGEGSCIAPACLLGLWGLWGITVPPSSLGMIL